MSQNRHYVLSGLLARDPTATDLNQTHLLVLEQVCGHALTANDIAARINISLSQLSRLIAKLQELKLVQRSDDRPARISATEPGRAMIQRINAYVQSCLAA